MNLNSNHKSVVYRLYLSTILFCFIFPIAGNSQLVINKNGEIVLSDYYFNSDSLKKDNVKSISTSYFKKEPLQSIYPVLNQSEFYFIDSNGFLFQKLLNKQNQYGRNDSTAELFKYENELLTEIKIIKEKKVQIKNVVYKENQPYVIVYASAENKSPNISKPKLNNYQDEKVEYLEYKTLENGDTLIKYKNINKVVFKKVLKERLDSQTLKISHSFVFNPVKNKTYTYYYNNNRLMKLKVTGKSEVNHYYSFTYNEQKELISFSKFELQWDKKIDQSKLVYDEKTGNLQAIICKKESGLILIKKFKYNYYE